MWSDKQTLLLQVLAFTLCTEAAITGWTVPFIGTGNGNGVISVSEDQTTYFVFTNIVANTDASYVSQYVYTVQSSPISVLTDGGVQIFSTLDFETTASYTIEVEAIDDTSATGTATIIISVTDVNEATPSFDESDYDACIADESPTDSTLATVLATDLDTSNTVTYSITGGNVNTDFKIDPNTGVIQVNVVALDATLTASYELQVEANDDGSPALTGTTTVSVTVGDCNKASAQSINGVAVSMVLALSMYNSFISKLAA